jgi:hypothetical protein
MEYEGRLREREILSRLEPDRNVVIEPNNLKFASTGEIKPYYGFTCIAWIDPETQLYENLCKAQKAIQAEFERAGIAHYFPIVNSASLHMTICDISARSTPYTNQEAQAICSKIQDSFPGGLKLKAISAKVRGVGLKSTISALVRFECESDLQKVLHLENLIKQAAQVDIRNFAGHITLAYCVAPLRNQFGEVVSILQSWQNFDFGEITFSSFDLTCFTNMNTYIPLVTIHIETGQIEGHPNQQKCFLN